MGSEPSSAVDGVGAEESALALLCAPGLVTDSASAPSSEPKPSESVAPETCAGEKESATEMKSASGGGGPARRASASCPELAGPSPARAAARRCSP